MKVLQLRNYIPIASPARREPADGNEPDLRVSIGFEPKWFSKRCGADFSEQWHRDPFARYRSLKKLKKELNRIFPSVEQWRRPGDRELATLSGCYGAYLIPQFFGMDLIYFPDRWPELDVSTRPSIGALEGMTADDAMNAPILGELCGQIDVIESEWGVVDGYLNYQGVLNNAFHLRGEELFTDLFDRPSFVSKLFRLIAEVMIRVARLVQERQRRSGFAINQLSVSHCVLNMISPAAYAEFILSCDQHIADSFERFGVHTCNWNIDPYTEVLSRLPRVGYIDMGLSSNLVAAKEAFPHARRAVIYAPWKLVQSPLSEIRSDLRRIANELAPCDVVMADIPAETPDDRVNSFLQICDEAGC